MKTTTQSLFHQATTFAALVAAAVYFSATTAQATNYAGNGNTGFGGAVGSGVLSLTDDGTNISGTFTTSGTFNDVLVLYIDTGAAGGFTSTTNFSDAGDGLRKAISGWSGSQRSALAFTNGFTPKFAVALGPRSDSFGGVWQLASGGNNSLNYLNSVNLSPTGGSASSPFTFTLPATNIGLTNGVQKTIKIFGTYISHTGFRSPESVAGAISGPQGYFPFSQLTFASYIFAGPPAPTNAVTFRVDMTAQTNGGAFVPGTDTVYCGGSFQNSPYTFNSFPLARVGTSLIYTNTFPDTNPTNSVEQFKFMFHSVVTNVDVFDSDLNRQFTLKAGAQTLPVVYFDYVFPTPSATTNSVKFSVDLGPQIFIGGFDPATMQVQALGTFENPKWTAGFILTNNPTLSGNSSNIYSGTIADGNYPGGFEQYKFVISTNGGGLRYEDFNGGANRFFFTPTNSGALPLAYFNGISTYQAVPITFLVDMTVPLLTHQLDLSRGDTVGCAGTFQTNSFTVGAAGFLLTNVPGGNIYRGTYIDRNAPGTGERYKFVINTNGGDTAYESPASTGGNDRQFLLGSAAATNPVVFWNDYSPNDVLLVDTTVTFTVSLTNTVDRFGNPFDPDSDLVVVDGDFFQPQWQVMSHFADPTLFGDYAGGHVMNRTTPTSLTYTLSTNLPAGSPVHVTYKYGIIHDNNGVNNTNVDNEADFGLNHTRYIRSLGSTDGFPLDLFGQQRTDLPGATEPAFGQLAIGGLSAGKFPVTWLGRRGVHLQSRTNLVSGAWQDLNATDGYSSTNWPVTTMPNFFRLVQP